MQQKSLTGWITKVYKRILEVLFKTFLGGHLKKNYGLSFNPAITLSELPPLMPQENDFFTVADDVSYFEVVRSSIQDRTVTIRELGTDIDYDIDPDLFQILFIKVDKPDIKRY